MRRIVAVVLIIAAIALAPLALALFALAQAGSLIASAGGPADLLRVPSLWYLVPAIASLVAAVVGVWLLWQERSTISQRSDGVAHRSEAPVGIVNRWLESESNYLAQLARVVGGEEHVDGRDRLATYRQAAALHEPASRAIISIGSSPLLQAFSRWTIARVELDEYVRIWAARPNSTSGNVLAGSGQPDMGANGQDVEVFLAFFNEAVGAVEDIRTALANVGMPRIPTRPL